MLYKKITRLITDSGIIPLDLYMTTAIQHYYGCKDDLLGHHGDFTTAPEISSIFCITIFLWIYQLWQVRPSDLVLVELGPGNGTLMSDMLRFACCDRNFYTSIKKIFLLENSVQMRSRQAEVLKTYTEKDIIWCSDIHELTNVLTRTKDKFEVVFIANEFFDAMPIKQFIARKNSANINMFYEVFITRNSSDENNFCFITNSNAPITTQDMQTIMQYSNCEPDDFNDGDIYEMSIIGLSILSNIARLIEQFNGNCLIIDYGYKKNPKRSTLKAIYKHQLLKSIFSQMEHADISAHVDFSAMHGLLAKNHEKLQVSYYNQSEFLQKNSADFILIKLLETANEDIKMQIKSAFDTIVNEMGGIFKVLTIRL